MGISLWRGCARNVRIASFHAQVFGRAIRAAPCPRGRRWRCFSRSVGVPPRDRRCAAKALSRACERWPSGGGETIGERGAQVPRWRIGKPAPGASGRKTVQALPSGRREAMGRQRDATDGTSRLCTEAGASKPQGLRSPRTQAGGRRDGPARVRPRPGRGRCERPLRGSWRSGRRQDARSA